MGIYTEVEIEKLISRLKRDKEITDKMNERLEATTQQNNVFVEDALVALEQFRTIRRRTLDFLGEVKKIEDKDEPWEDNAQEILDTLNEFREDIE